MPLFKVSNWQEDDLNRPFNPQGAQPHEIYVVADSFEVAIAQGRRVMGSVSDAQRINQQVLVMGEPA